MVDGAISAPRRAAPRPAPPASGRRRRPHTRSAWALTGLAVFALAVLFVMLTGARPAYDAYGWLVWGHQTLRLNLNTGAAPSWKPLSYLFTLPYALAGRRALLAWMVTSTAAALAAPLFAGRIAYRLAGDGSTPPWGRGFAALTAGAAVLGLAGYWHFVLIDTADPMMVMLGLASIDAHLSGRRRWAWGLLVLLALGRPEGWPVAALYALWAWFAVPSMRKWLVLGAVAIPGLWFGIARLTSPSFFVAGNVDMRTAPPLPAGSGAIAVLHGLSSLYERPMKVAVIVALALAGLLRERRWIVIAGAAVLWVATEVSLGMLGWRPAPRYMLEPAAVFVVLVGAGAGRLLTVRRVPVRVIAAAAIVALAVVMAPHARMRLRLAHNGIVLGQNWALVIDRLHQVVAGDGARRILNCGHPVTTLPFQSILAWELGTNVGDIGASPGAWVRSGRPIVLFLPDASGWTIHPIHTRGAGCGALATTTATDGTPLASHIGG